MTTTDQQQQQQYSNNADSLRQDQVIDPALSQDEAGGDGAVGRPLQLGVDPAGRKPPNKVSMQMQAKALFRKSVMYQARNLSANVCIVSAPVLFCILLLCLQAGVQKMLSSDEFTVRFEDSTGTHCICAICCACLGPQHQPGKMQPMSQRHRLCAAKLCAACLSAACLPASACVCSAAASAPSAATKATATTAL